MSLRIDADALTWPAVTLLAVALIGCSGAPDARTVPDAATRGIADPAGDSSGLVLLLACDREFVSAGEHIPVRVILQNRSDRPIRVECPKHSPYGAFRVVVEREDGSEVRTPYDDPYFYVYDPMVRSGFELTPVELPDPDDEICLLPAHLEWEGRIGTTKFACGGEYESIKPVYLTLNEPGLYTIRVVYRFDRAAADEVLRKRGERADFSNVPELDVSSNALEVTVGRAPSAEEEEEEEEEEENEE